MNTTLKSLSLEEFKNIRKSFNFRGFSCLHVVKSILFIRYYLATFGLLFFISTYGQQNNTVDTKVYELIGKMTLSEKISQLGNGSPAISRLGIKRYEYWNEAIHGVARSGLATSFPQANAMSCTWNPNLIYQIATAISDEARVYNNTNGKGLTYWSPTINMARDPRWGREEENYGEDTYLASKIAVSFITGMQGDDPNYLKTVATAKHFACNNIEYNRYGISSEVDERSLREYYLPVFKECVTKGNVYSIMSAYNGVNGVPSSANQTLLNRILREEWDFDGYVVSDCDAVANVWDAHRYVSNGSQASAISILNGTDLNCGQTYQNDVAKAIGHGILTEKHIDTALFRVFKARFLLGEFDSRSSVPYTKIPDTVLAGSANSALALKAAREAIVLLKNENNILPLNIDDVNSLAVIGPNAASIQLGGYSGTPKSPVSPLQGIATKMGVELFFDKIEAEDFDEQSGIQTESCNEGGFNIGYIQNGDFARYDNIAFGRGKTKLEFRVATESDGGNIEVRLDNKDGSLIKAVPVVSTGGWQNWETITLDIDTIKNNHTLYLKFTGGSGYLFNLNWFKFTGGPDDGGPVQEIVRYNVGCGVKGSIVQSELDSAVSIAKKSDYVVLVCGTDLSVADEGHDRADLGLPGSQEALIEAVYNANQNTILVLVTGFPLAINWAQENLPGIMCAWYGGQSQGRAIADVLFGDYNPAGRLSTTWYKSPSDLPHLDDYDIKNGRTYQYFKGEPLYPFGYGLSYSSFEYSNLKLSSDHLNSDDSLAVLVDITNNGAILGDEVAQLYVHVNSGIIRPIKQLNGFERITLLPGETQTIRFVVKHSDLTYYDLNERAFKVESGTADILVGSSSENIRLTEQINVSEGVVEYTYRQNATNLFQAELLESKSKAVELVSGKNEGISVELNNNNDFIGFKNVDFGEGIVQVNAYLSTLAEHSKLEIVLDSIDGKIAGEIAILPSETLSKYNTQWCSLESISGVHDVYLKYINTDKNSCHLDWFKFLSAPEIPSDIDDYLGNPIISVYPNPAKDYLFVKGADENSVFTITSLSGEGVVNSHQLPLNLSGLTQGIYILKIESDNKVFFKKFIIN